MNIYLKYIKPNIHFYILAPLLMLVEVYCALQIPTLSAHILNKAVLEDDLGAIYKIALLMLVVVICAVLSGVAASYCATRAAVDFAHDIREEVYSKIQGFSFSNIDKFSTGSLITRLTNDINQLQQMVIMSLRMAIRAPGMLVGSLLMALSINRKISIVFIILIPILAAVIILVLYCSYRKFKVLQTKIDAINIAVKEVVTNIRVMKAFTREKYEKHKFESANNELLDINLETQRIQILQSPCMVLCINIATIVVLWMGNKAIGNKEILIGDLSALLSYLTSILLSINMLAMIFMNMTRAFVSGERIKELLEEEIDIKDLASEGISKKIETGSIRFESVDFKYFEKSEEKVLRDINIEIEAGQTVGIIGPTGCGKTSFVHLIPRLYDVTSGAVYIDGINVKDYSLKDLREGISIVLQNNLLFSGSIYENLIWGDENATEKEIKLAQKYAVAEEFIQEKVDGIEAHIEQGGKNFSGGQKQRLCIARALVKKAKILILDDSTSALDMETERKIKGYFDENLKGITKLIIAQRITSIKMADQIIVLNEGRLEAAGTHEELLKGSKTYQEIYYSQSEQEAVEDGK